jgi:hypothetical protein
MKKLVLKDEELDSVVLPREEFTTLREEARWMAVVKVNTSKHFGNQPFFQKMDAAWSFARQWSIRPVEDNLFVLQVSCLGDWNRAILEGPWIFWQMGVMIEPYDGIADPNSVVLNRLHVWAQIRGVPPLFRKDPIVRDMAARIGEVLGVDLYALGASGTSFVQVRIKLDVGKPLTRVVGLHPEGYPQMVFQVLYEKLPKFCEVCGLFGHGGLECDDGVHEEEAKQYGAWMVAPMEDWHPQTSGVRGKQKEENGGGGQGAKPQYRKRPPGESPPAARTSTQAGSKLMELTDGKVDGAMVIAPGARKNLGMDMEA